MITFDSEISQLNKDQLTDIQTKLKALGYYNLAVDGIFGQGTANAWANWKKDNHLAYPSLIGASSYKILSEQTQGRQSVINWNDPASKVSKYFTVGEVTNNDRRRIPINATIQSNIITLARELDKVREAFGNPIRVTSWYRPTAINTAVGGARNSQHITGRAADIAPVSGMSIHHFQTWLDARWFGAFGYGAKRGGFVHIDTRNGKGFNSGGVKGPRWNY
jgi:hypothetical protein